MHIVRLEEAEITLERQGASSEDTIINLQT